MMNFTKQELDTAKKIIKEWKASGDIDLLSWIDYKEKNPAVWTREPNIEFNPRGNENQKKAIEYWNDQTTDQILYSSGKGGGGTYLGLWMILSDAIKYPGTTYFIARKKLNDLMKYVVYSMQEVIIQMDLKITDIHFNQKDHYYSLPNGSRIYLIDCKFMAIDPSFSRLASMSFTRGFIDNVNEIESAAVRSLLSSVGRWKNEEYNIRRKVIMKCFTSPPGSQLYEEWWIPYKNATLPESKKFIHATIKDNKMLAAGYLENLESSLSEGQKQRLIYNNWDYHDTEI